MDKDALERIRNGAAADEMMVLAALREEVERLDPRSRVEVSGPVGGEQVHIRLDHETRNAVSLHNLWKQLRGVSGEEAAETIERFARTCVANFFSGAVEKEAESIMPAVRDTEYMDSLRRQAFDPACRELSTCGTLFVCLVLDTPEYVSYLQRSDPEGLGLSGFEGAEKMAIANLAQYARASGSLSVESRPALLDEAHTGSSQGHQEVMVHRLALDGDYDVSLVLLADLARHLCADPQSPLGHLGGPENMAFALPSRDILLIADVREERAAEALSLLARPIHDNAAYAISSRVYRYARTDERILLMPVELRQT